MQTALLRSELVCPASKEISAIEAFTDDFRNNSIVGPIIGIFAGAAALGLAVGVLLLLSVRFSHGTPAHNLLSEKLRRLVVSDHVSGLKGTRFTVYFSWHFWFHVLFKYCFQFLITADLPTPLSLFV